MINDDNGLAVFSKPGAKVGIMVMKFGDFRFDRN
jgi:hypothetical protein